VCVYVCVCMSDVCVCVCFERGDCDVFWVALCSAFEHSPFSNNKLCIYVIVFFLQEYPDGKCKWPDMHSHVHIYKSRRAASKMRLLEF